jgi:hypothetical protein
MNNRSVIVLGLAVFLIAVAYPFWSTLLSGADVSRPVLERPVGRTQCVEETTFMRQNHMQILDEWRIAAVRNGAVRYTSKAFKVQYEASLTKTCLGCHKNRAAFCDRCHNYAKVTPTCWNCHNSPSGTN